jgi:hypothetical protein
MPRFLLPDAAEAKTRSAPRDGEFCLALKPHRELSNELVVKGYVETPAGFAAKQRE